MGNRTRRIGAIVIGLAVPLVTLGSAHASLPPGSVGTPQLRIGAVTPPKLAFHSVRSHKLDRGAVTTEALSPEAVARGKLQDNAVNSSKVAKGSLNGSDIDQLTLDFGILQRRIAAVCDPGEAIRAVTQSGNVTCQSVGGGSPSGPAGGDLTGNYPNPRIAPGAVTTAKLDDGAVTRPKLGFDVDELAYWKLSGNAGTDGTDFLGTTDNTPLNVRVNDARALRLEPDTVSPNLIGGHADNRVTDGASGATISGGGGEGAFARNRVSDDYGTIGGGADNQAA